MICKLLGFFCFWEKTTLKSLCICIFEVLVFSYSVDHYAARMVFENEVPAFCVSPVRFGVDLYDCTNELSVICRT